MNKRLITSVLRCEQVGMLFSGAETVQEAEHHARVLEQEPEMKHLADCVRTMAQAREAMNLELNRLKQLVDFRP